MPLVNVNNIDLYYEESGKGFPIVLISGLGGSSASWQTVRNILSRKYRVIVFDNRGAGRSSAPDAAYTIAQMSDDLHSLLKHLNITRTHILGHSMGGFIAQDFALRYSSMVEKLLLCCTSDKLSKRNKALFENMYESWKSGLSKELWFRELYCWVFSQNFFDDEQIIDFAVQFALEYPYQQSLAGFKGQLLACVGFNSTEKLKYIKHNTLIIVGHDDILITPNESKILNKRISNSKMLGFDGCGHTVHVENRDAFSKTVLEFLNN